MLVLVALFLAADGTSLPTKPGWTTTTSFTSPHATQAAAADDKHAYAVSNTTVAVHDRKTGKLLSTSTGPAEHLNSAYLWDAKLFCAHSNYPKKPDESDIRVFDPATGKLAVYHKFVNPPGSLTWCVRGRDGKGWWCCFAHYQADNAKTVVVEMTNEFTEQRRLTFPKKVVDDWDKMSASGVVWDGDTLLVSHHHYPVLYRLRVPNAGGELELVEALTCPFPGQGIAVDPATPGGLVGIDRTKRTVVFAKPAK